MTVKQLQYLLSYLGYDTGGTEGAYGPKTRQAVTDFQQGYGGLAVDGEAGAATKKALREAVGDGWKRPIYIDDVPESGPIPEDRPGPAWWADIKYFERAEFRCPCGQYCDGYPVEPTEKLVRLMDSIRDELGGQVIIVPPDGHSGGSGVRCQRYNDTLKGSAKNSKHLKGKAADWSAPGKANAVIKAMLARRQAAGEISYWYEISPGNYHTDVD